MFISYKTEGTTGVIGLNYSKHRAGVLTADDDMGVLTDDDDEQK